MDNKKIKQSLSVHVVHRHTNEAFTQGHGIVYYRHGSPLKQRLYRGFPSSPNSARSNRLPLEENPPMNCWIMSGIPSWFSGWKRWMRNHPLKLDYFNFLSSKIGEKKDGSKGICFRATLIPLCDLIYDFNKHRGCKIRANKRCFPNDQCCSSGQVFSSKIQYVTVNTFCTKKKERFEF